MVLTYIIDLSRIMDLRDPRISFPRTYSTTPFLLFVFSCLVVDNFGCITIIIDKNYINSV